MVRRGCNRSDPAQRSQPLSNTDSISRTPPCDFPDCGRPVLAKGLCQAHYRMQHRGEELRSARYQHKPYAFKKCSGPQCERHATCKGLCTVHYKQQWTTGVLKPLSKIRNRDKTCEFPECNRPVATAGFCQAHYRQKRLGKEMKPVHEPSYRYVHTGGYIVVMDPSHPNADKSGRIMEHVKVMSEILGRPLLPKETVHHKNGRRDDNRPENLQLWSSRHPKGQRVEDLVQFAREILDLYG